jgi:RNA polymerase sigma-70 factor (ECF subfamily)
MYKMPPQIDLATILKAKTGDATSFRQLVETYQSYLYSVAFRYLGGIYEAEDAVQEVFVKTWKNLHNYRPEIKFTTWLYKILINHCLDAKKQKMFRAQQNSLSVEIIESMAASSSPLTVLTQAEVSQAIVKAASTALAGKQKMVFVLRDLEGLEPREVCQMLDMNETQLKSNLYHARKKMYELLKDKI